VVFHDNREEKPRLHHQLTVDKPLHPLIATVGYEEAPLAI
jgi:hypothetical protein